MGYLKGNVVYETLNGKAKPSFEFWERFFNSEYSKIIDGTWMITGNGTMLRTTETGSNSMIVVNEGPPLYGDFQNRLEKLQHKLNDAESKLSSKGLEKLIPYYDVDFEAGFSVLENNQQINPDAFISDPLFAGSDYVVRLAGDSMSKRIPAGSYLGVKRVEFVDVLFGETYGLVTKSNFRTVKNVRKSKLKNHVLLVPENTESYDAQDYPVERVLSWWLVVAYGTKLVGV